MKEKLRREGAKNNTNALRNPNLSDRPEKDSKTNKESDTIDKAINFRKGALRSETKRDDSGERRSGKKVTISDS